MSYATGTCLAITVESQWGVDRSVVYFRTLGEWRCGFRGIVLVRAFVTPAASCTTVAWFFSITFDLELMALFTGKNFALSLASPCLFFNRLRVRRV
jgi:hypothetical protein